MSHASSSASHDEHGESHGSFGSYLVGFVIAVVLTAAAFAAVMMHAMSPGVTIGVISALAVVQIFVHVIYFLHMNGSSAQAWNRICFFFAIGCCLIIVFGVLFVMHDTSMNMMSR